MKTVLARTSIFEKHLRPVENPVAVLRQLRRRLGPPYLVSRRTPGLRVYRFPMAFDAFTLIVAREGVEIPQDIGTRF